MGTGVAACVIVPACCTRRTVGCGIGRGVASRHSRHYAGDVALGMRTRAAPLSTIRARAQPRTVCADNFTLTAVTPGLLSAPVELNTVRAPPYEA